jgi:hypothetical protein
MACPPYLMVEGGIFSILKPVELSAARWYTTLRSLRKLFYWRASQ